MTDICCGVVSESETSPPRESSNSRATRRRRMKIRSEKLVDEATPVAEITTQQNRALLKKRPKLELLSLSRPCDNAVYNCDDKHSLARRDGKSEVKVVIATSGFCNVDYSMAACPKFGATSVCGRRRDMEDAVDIHPSFSRLEFQAKDEYQLHYFAVYDGHGCSHVAEKCKERLRELVKEELECKKDDNVIWWETLMERSFNRMDKEVTALNGSMIKSTCRCELQSPECDAVGSTAVVAIVTPDKIIVANCGDSRAVLCRNGQSIPLSKDHKPDRPDEQNRIEEVGGQVIYWDGPRVLGVLAMSRAIGDQFLKPYVICQPEVTITDRTVEDECLILASDGLWDVISNDTACGVARTCLKGKAPPSSMPSSSEYGIVGEENFDQACLDASMLLTKISLARWSTDNVSVVVVDLRNDA